MAAKKVGNLIKKARTEAEMTQEQLAKMVSGLSAADISKAERGEKELTTDQLKTIAKALGITQKSLLEAAGGAKSSSGSAKTSTSSKTASSAATNSMKLTAAEKKLVEQYRKADADTKKSVMNLLKGDSGSGVEAMVKDMLGSAIKDMLKQK